MEKIGMIHVESPDSTRRKGGKNWWGLTLVSFFISFVVYKLIV
jgi:hypothetical protein